MAISRKRQYQLLTEHGIENDEKLEMVDALPLKDVRVVFQGVEGAYSYAAMREYFQDDIESFHVKTWRDAMEAVVEGKADYAVLPIENTTAGIVADIYDLLTEYELNIVGEQIIRPEHVLLGLPDANWRISDRYVLILRRFPSVENIWNLIRTGKKKEMENTAGSAKKIKEDNDKTQAAIASQTGRRALRTEDPG